MLPVAELAQPQVSHGSTQNFRTPTSVSKHERQWFRDSAHAVSTAAASQSSAAKGMVEIHIHWDRAAMVWTERGEES